VAAAQLMLASEHNSQLEAQLVGAERKVSALKLLVYAALSF
jgi:hypothetical protein